MMGSLSRENNARQSLRRETEHVFLSSREGRVVRGEEHGGRCVSK